MCEFGALAFEMLLIVAALFLEQPVRPLGVPIRPTSKVKEAECQMEGEPQV